MTITRRVLFCLGIPAIFVAWAAASRFLYHGVFEQMLGVLWWPFAVLGLFSSLLGVLLLRASNAHDALGTFVSRIESFRSERDALQIKIDFLTAEREIGMILNDNLERRIVLDRVLEMTANLLRADPDGQLRLYLRDLEKDAVGLAAARIGGRALTERELKRRRADDAIMEPAAMQARVIFASEHERIKIWIPLLTDGVVAGVLEIRMSETLGLSDLEENLEEYGRFLSLAIRAPELYRRAVYDPLTGLGSRRQFDQMLGSYIERTLLGRTTFSVVMIDIDHFKNVNDTHGHEAGDAVLRGVAETIRRNIRRNAAGACDGFRYGGEEMVLLVEGAASPAAAQIAERLRRAVDRKGFLAKRKRISVTISLGVASADRDPAGVLSRADAALYRAKNGGRNLVQVAS